MEIAIFPMEAPVHPLDLILTIVFSSLGLGGAATTVLALRKALRVATERDGDLKMFLWAVVSLVGLIIAGMSVAYFLLPILIHNLK